MGKSSTVLSLNNWLILTKQGISILVSHFLSWMWSRVPGGLFEYFLRETGQSLRLFLVPLQVLGQQVTERAQCLLLEHQPLWLDQTLGDGGLKLSTSTQLKLGRKIMDSFTNMLINRRKYSNLIGLLKQSWLPCCHVLINTVCCCFFLWHC